jgi:hypothetical protein
MLDDLIVKSCGHTAAPSSGLEMPITPLEMQPQTGTTMYYDQLERASDLLNPF